MGSGVVAERRAFQGLREQGDIMSTLKMPIETERLVLRPFEKEDIESVMGYHRLPEVQRYLDWKIRDKVDVIAALEAMRSQITLQRPGDTLSLAVVRKAGDVLVGQVSLRWVDATAGQGEIRFVFNPDYRGKGLASEAVRRLIDIAFEDFNIHRIFARCDARNSRSARLMTRLGMRLEAHYREHALFQGEWDEELHFAILDREWQRSSKVRELTHRVA
ncbi:MAG TPA: GNAT family protein [Devosiaceae bacterium]|jgi:RimJ/RimL family protein N-acetyltransferase